MELEPIRQERKQKQTEPALYEHINSEQEVLDVRLENAEHVWHQEKQCKLVYEERTIDLSKNVEVYVAVVQQTESIPQIHRLFCGTEKILVLAETRQRSQNGQRFSEPKDGSIAIPHFGLRPNRDYFVSSISRM